VNEAFRVDKATIQWKPTTSISAITWASWKTRSFYQIWQIMLKEKGRPEGGLRAYLR
jgi:hypothetical protein